MAPKKKASKKVPPSSGLRPKIGRRYVTEKGSPVKIDRVDAHGDFFGQIKGRDVGVWNPKGKPWSVNGFTDQTYGSLVREVVKRRGK